MKTTPILCKRCEQYPVEYRVISDCMDCPVCRDCADKAKRFPGLEIIPLDKEKRLQWTSYARK